ncbi:unnamed protein product [Acanthoscelides obtectus]|uniref:Uncharacterized protein n=1 Tax=Acanthoscelides obtectus TaxID=200917 RepID=A0A9P0P8G4_ACAOB|nr:unnamed protein product [Acanthoscelides obtectus]CAK1635037.1 hypothetical protein AOBTE_LOCUS9016 [Acanthoscelides obtectus]
MRPNYSHLFSKTRNRDPSQTETFLGQITLQSPPIEDPPQFDVFPEVANNPYADGVEGNSVGGNNGRNGFLNHRSRFVAPDQPLKKPQVKDYFVDNHGDVYSTTKAPRTTPPSTKSTIQERKYPFKSPSKAKPPVPFNLEKERKGIQTKSPRQKAADLEPLLEEPLKENFGTSNDDEVEVIQSENDTIVGKSGDDHRRPKMLPLSPTKESSKTTQSSDPSTTYYDDNEELSTHLPTESDDYAEDELYEEEEDQKNNNDNDIQGGEDNDQHEANQEKDQPSEEHSQVLTTSKPTTTNSKGKLYTSIDRTFRYPTTEPPTTAIDDLEPTTFSPSISSSKSVSFKRGEQMLHKEPELVISVVTSKTVINNTVVAPVTEVPTVTESIKGVATTPTTAVDNTTEAWVVVASVQTSRSVSGARYLPSSIVEQDIRVKLLNEHATEDDDDSDHDHQHQDDDIDEEDDEDEEHTTTETTIMPTTTRPKTSTESLIDKLDGLQSDLSSGVLTGGLGNNIAVIKETTLETTTASTSTSANYPSTTSKPYPQVKIRKFSPANRPTTTRKPRPKPGEKKPFDINQLQGDQPRKPVDIASILPPNYKLNASDDRSLRILQELVDRNLKNKKKDESSTTSTAEQTTENGLKITQDVTS